MGQTPLFRHFAMADFGEKVISWESSFGGNATKLCTLETWTLMLETWKLMYFHIPTTLLGFNFVKFINFVVKLSIWYIHPLGCSKAFDIVYTVVILKQFKTASCIFNKHLKTFSWINTKRTKNYMLVVFKVCCLLVADQANIRFLHAYLPSASEAIWTQLYKNLLALTQG